MAGAMATDRPLDRDESLRRRDPDPQTALPFPAAAYREVAQE
jgi:hypothetical protein